MSVCHVIPEFVRRMRLVLKWSITCRWLWLWCWLCPYTAHIPLLSFVFFLTIALTLLISSLLGLLLSLLDSCVIICVIIAVVIVIIIVVIQKLGSTLTNTYTAHRSYPSHGSYPCDPFTPTLTTKKMSGLTRTAWNNPLKKHPKSVINPSVGIGFLSSQRVQQLKASRALLYDKPAINKPKMTIFTGAMFTIPSHAKFMAARVSHMTRMVFWSSVFLIKSSETIWKMSHLGRDFYTLW